MVATPERRRTTVKGTVPAGKVPRSTPLWCADEIRAYRPYRAAGDVTPAGLLLFAVREDSIVPPSHSRRIHEYASEPKRLSANGPRRPRPSAGTMAWLAR